MEAVTPRKYFGSKEGSKSAKRNSTTSLPSMKTWAGMSGYLAQVSRDQ